MVGALSSSSSSCTSSGSLDDFAVKFAGTIKFLYSYGGKILPRYPDGKLRYVGGQTRVLSVGRSIAFAELQAKLGELSGWAAVHVRCQLPAEDIDALVTVTSDEDLANLVKEYDVASRDRFPPLKIRSFLLPKPSSISTTPHAQTPMSAAHVKGKKVLVAADRCVHQASVPGKSHGDHQGRNAAAGNRRFHYHRPQPRHDHGSPKPCICLVHHGDHRNLFLLKL